MNRRGFIGRLIGLFGGLACLGLSKSQAEPTPLKASVGFSDIVVPSTIAYETLEVLPNGEKYRLTYNFIKTFRFTTLEDALEEIQSVHTWQGADYDPNRLVCTEGYNLDGNMVILSSVCLGGFSS